MKTSRPQPMDQEWLQHKPAIRRLYIVDEMPLKKLVAELERLGLSVTTSQLEYKLKQWGFRKNIDKATWAILDRKIAKRKREGKESQVIHCGKRLKATTVEKETSRHRDISVFAQLNPPSSPPASPNNAQLAVCTPQSLPMEFTWPSTLPWFTFQNRVSNLFSDAFRKGNSKAVSILLPHAELSNCLVPIFAQDSELQSTGEQPRISKLAAIIGKSMPESYPEENLHRAQSLLHRSSSDIIRENLTSIIFSISNNLSNLFDESTWEKTLNILQACGVLNVETNLWKLQDLTTRGFMENLFPATLHWTIGRIPGENFRRSRVFTVLERLISSGISPDSGIFLPALSHMVDTPLRFATRHGDLELTRYLLGVGADVNLILPNGDQCSPLELGLDNEAIVATHLTDLLLRYGASTNLDQALHLAISKGHMNLVESIIKQGANISGTWNPSDSFIFEQTALSSAASVGESETQLILDLLAAQDPTKSVKTFITADIMVAAAAKGMRNSIRLLQRVCSDINMTTPNFYGVTPLHAAACNGHLDTCQLILQLHGSYPSSTSFTSPLHLALVSGRVDIVHLFINNGADVNTAQLLRTPLEMLLHKTDVKGGEYNLRYDHLDCVTALVQAGSKLTGREVSLAAAYSHLGLLSATLTAGGDPNENIDGTSALQRALSGTHHENHATGVLIVKFLLERGATLLGGEVVSAVFLGDWDLVNLLIRHGGYLTETDMNGTTVLEMAILSKQHLIVQYVLSLQPNLYDAGVLCAAILIGTEWVVSQLISNRPLDKSTCALEATAIGLAAKLRRFDVLTILLERVLCPNEAFVPLEVGGWDDPFDIKINIAWKPSTRASDLPPPFWRDPSCVMGSPLALAVTGRDAKACHELLQNGCQPDGLTWSIIAHSNDLSIAKVFLENNQQFRIPLINTNQRIDTPLKYSIIHGNNELTLLLLDAGADVNEYNLKGIYGRSPLQIAVETGNLEIIGHLLNAGAKVNAPPAYSRGATALQLAAIKGHLGIAKHLLELGAEVNARSAGKSGRTALEGAAEYGRLDMLELLIHDGALNGEDGRNQLHRCIKIATKMRRMAAVELLRGYWRWDEKDGGTSTTFDGRI